MLGRVECATALRNVAVELVERTVSGLPGEGIRTWMGGIHRIKESLYKSPPARRYYENISQETVPPDGGRDLITGQSHISFGE